MSEPQSHSKEPNLASQIPKRTHERAPNDLAGVIYWQVLVGLFGFVISLGLQFWLGLPFLIDALCGTQALSVEFVRCSEAALRSSFLISLASTASLSVALGASLIGSFRRIKGSLIYSWAVSYIFFAFAATLRESFFLELMEGTGEGNAYILAAVALGGSFVAAIAYHVPRWLLSSTSRTKSPHEVLESQQHI